MEIILELLYQFLLGFFATIGFAVYFLVPKDSLLPAGLAGGLSWVLYYIILNNFYSKILGTFLGAILAGLLGEYLAVKLKKPASVFITPGIIPFVPGAGMYYTMLYLVQNDYTQAAIVGTETLFIAAAIAIGIIVSTVFSRYLRFIIKNHS